MLLPNEIKNVLAIAPPIIMVSIFFIRFLINGNFVEILLPPIIATIGFLEFSKALDNAFISLIKFGPANDGIYF